jgi:hypothetical protein
MHQHPWRVRHAQGYVRGQSGRGGRLGESLAREEGHSCQSAATIRGRIPKSKVRAIHYRTGIGCTNRAAIGGGVGWNFVVAVGFCYR